MEITTLLDEFICAALVHNQAQNTEQQSVTGASNDAENSD